MELALPHDLPSAPSDGDSVSQTKFILQNARSGDQEAWKALFSRYDRMLLVAVEYKMPGFLKRRYDAEDILQAAFHKAFDRIESFQYRGEDSFRRWLRKIVMRELQTLHKSDNADRRRPTGEDAGSQWLDKTEANSPAPSQFIKDIEEREGMMALLRSMPEADQELISMRVFEGRTWTEVGEVLGCGRDMAKVRFDRLIAKLARGLG